jgi:DNA-binding transcriptional LysR family regulator
MHLTLKQLKVFEAVAAYRSYTEAAKKMHMTQPAVSMQIKHLEDQAGLSLFDRLGRRISITNAGEELLHYSKAIHQQLEEAEQVLEELKGLKRGKLHLTMASTANYFAPQLIAAFHQEYPDAKVNLDVTNRAGLISAVENNTTDMVIMGRPPQDDNLVGIPFMDNPLVAIAAPSHPLAKKKKISLAELQGETFIVREKSSGTRIAVDRFFSEHRLELSAGMEMNRSEAIKQAVMAELGLGIVSLHTLDMELSLKRLVVLNVEDFPIMRQWHIVHRKGKRFAAIPDAFKNFVLDHATELIKLPG